MDIRSEPSQVEASWLTDALVYVAGTGDRRFDDSRLGFSQLEPGTRYALQPEGTGSSHGTRELVAGPDGTAIVEVTLATDGATRFRLTPAGGAA